jgi:hypothetical protein
MPNNTNFPILESHLPDLMNFVTALVQGYQSREIDSWQVLEEKVFKFFSIAEVDKVNAVAPGWRDMAACAGGITLVHILAVFTALFLCPEFRQASKSQQEYLKWIVVFHDIAKEIQPGVRDFTHGFHSAAMTAKALPGLGFAITPEYVILIDEWERLVNSATTIQSGISIAIQNNDKLPLISSGIERLFGRNTPAALIVKTVLLHMSINVVEDWPQAAPLSGNELLEYVDGDLIPLMKVMMLVDNDAWSLFDPPTKERYRRETLAVFNRFA